MPASRACTLPREAGDVTTERDGCPRAAQRRSDVGRGVRRAVVDEHDGEAAGRVLGLVDCFEELRNGVGFVAAGDDERERRQLVGASGARLARLTQRETPCDAPSTRPRALRRRAGALHRQDVRPPERVVIKGRGRTLLGRRPSRRPARHGRRASAAPGRRDGRALHGRDLRPRRSRHVRGSAPRLARPRRGTRGRAPREPRRAAGCRAQPDRRPQTRGGRACPVRRWTPDARTHRPAQSRS